jgi:photosystem II stability/assembly factor-like uncharacterized protein
MKTTFGFVATLLCLFTVAVPSYSQWVQTNGPFAGIVTALLAKDNYILLGTQTGGVYRSTDNGLSWTSSSNGLYATPTTLEVDGFAVMGSNVYAATAWGVSLSTDNGISWTTVQSGMPSGRVYALAVSGNNLFAASGSAIYYSSNNGTSWNAANVGWPLTYHVTALGSVSSGGGVNTLLAATNGGGIYASGSNGNTWFAVNTGLTGTDVRSLLVSGTTMYAGTNGGGLFRSTNNGSNWTNLGLMNMNVSALAMSGTTLYAGTNKGIFSSTNNGTSWSDATNGLSYTGSVVLAVSGPSLFVGTNGGGVFLSSNNGASWAAANRGLTNMSVLALAASPSGGGSGANIFAGTDIGIFLSPDNGSTWTAVNNGLTSTYVNALTVSSSAAGAASNIFAGTSSDGVFRSTDNGTTWVKTALTGTNVLSLAVATGAGGSGSNLFAGTYHNGVYLSTDNGTNWSAVNTGLVNTDVYSLAVSGTNLFAGTGRGVYLSTNSGTSWTAVSSGLSNNTIVSLAALGSTLCAGAGETGVAGGVGAWASTNNGASWTTANTGLTDLRVMALGFSGTSLFAGTWFKGVHISTNSGTSWFPVNTGFPNLSVNALLVSGANLYVGTNQVHFAGTSLFGQSGGVWMRPLAEMVPAWLPQTSPLGTQALGQIQFVTSTEGWIVAGNGKLLHTTNAGSNWDKVVPGGLDSIEFNTDNLNSLPPLCFVNPTTGWIIGTSGGFQQAAGAVLFKTTNGGTSWSKQTLAGWSLGFGVQFVDANNGWAEVVNGNSSSFTYSIIRTTDGGNQWTSIYSSNSALCYPRFFDVRNGWAIIGTPGGAASSIVHTTDGGATWSTQFTDNTPGGLSRIQFLDLNNGWIVGDSSKIFHTTNGGSTWTRLANPGIDRSSMLRTLFFLDANTGWIGGQVASGAVPAFVLHTSNGGASWSFQGGAAWTPPNPCPVHSNPIGMYFVDANTGWMSTHYGDLVKTTTGSGVTAVGEIHGNGIPDKFSLEQNYPNPFNPSTTIRFELSQAADVSLRIYNVLGQLIATLVDEPKRAGAYQVQWSASNVPSGTYFYRLQSAGFIETKKMLLLR